jgi:hypothetical protein
MSALALMSLLGLALFLPVLMNSDDDENAEPSEPVDPVDPGDPIDPVDPVEPEEPILPASATLDEATNTVTVTTDPDETGTIYTVANRVDAVTGNDEANFVYETSVILVPEGVDLSEAIDEVLENGDSAYYYDILEDIGARELGFWAFEPGAAEGAEGAIQNFVYPEGAMTAFAQIYSVNFGDGGQIDAVIDVAGQDDLTDDIGEFISNTSFALVEDNGGAIVTLPSLFEGDLVVLETTEDYFFEGRLVRTDVTMQFATLDDGVNFATAALTLADQSTQTTTAVGTDYAIPDGSLTGTEFFREVPGAPFIGFSYGVSSTEFNADGTVLSEVVTGGIGTTSNVDIVRYEVQVRGQATPSSNPDNTWDIQSGAGIVTGFGDALNIPASDAPGTIGAVLA